MKNRSAHTAGHSSLVLARISCLMVTAACLVTGCSRIEIDRFSSATRADARLTPGVRKYDEPFGAAYNRLRTLAPAVCNDPDYMSRILDIIVDDKSEWVERWGVFLDSPAVSVTLYEDDRFLGSIKVYQSALGHAGNRLRTLEPEQTARLLDLICQCAQSDSPTGPPTSPD